ncbi:MAG: aconitate hydratase [Spirochaetaceae bacterium]|jgi:aconitate hydratase|nr:aconitate hydratase [Spirochaetaceae bacterium]
MSLTVTEKIIFSHIAGERKKRGETISIKIDQTLTQDATGTMTYLQFEGMGKTRVQTEISVSYVDHNTTQEDFKNMDDHRYLQSVAAKYGLYFSRAGNGICHQVHLEKFGAPGKTLLGSDSHTPTGGALGMLAIGAGGLDVAIAMAGGAFNMLMPKIYGVKLTGSLQKGAAAKDVILELLKRETVRGGVGAVYEYFGEGAASLSVTERATITNMGAELGATSSIFPSDGVVKEFLEQRGRGGLWTPITADEGAVYDKIIEINISDLKPLAACPHSPDAVKDIDELAGMPVDQVVIGSCTNSSLEDLAVAARVIHGKTVSKNVSAGISCGSRTVLLAAASSGILREFITAGFRILECACGPCIGMGFAPSSESVSLRTFNRNFKGRSGTGDAGVYIVSPQTAAASAIAGVFTRAGGGETEIYSKDFLQKHLNEAIKHSDDMIAPPLSAGDAYCAQIVRGPNIKPCPDFEAAGGKASLPVLLKAGDNISTDDIMPAGAKILPLRSNIPEISKYVFNAIDGDFYNRAKNAKRGVIVGGGNYGQGSSREHAALAPAYLGVKAVIVKQFARIHKANLINYGILPFTFVNVSFYNDVLQGDVLDFPEIDSFLKSGQNVMAVKNTRSGVFYHLRLEALAEERKILLAGGRIAYMRNSGGN